MTRTGALLRLAWRESRNSRGQLLAYMLAITLGVAAIVAIDSYAANIQRSVQEQSRSLLGGDIAFSSRQAFPDNFDSVLATMGIPASNVARVTTFASMALAQRSGLTRLVQVRAIGEEWPLYGEFRASPEGAVATMQRTSGVIIEKSLATTLQLAEGDSLRVGLQNFAVVGVIEAIPGEPGIMAAIGPRVIIRDADLDATQLLTFGSVAQREALVRLDPSQDARTVLRDIRRELDSAVVRGRTASNTEENLAESIDSLTGFLGLVGLIALLLGGIGVASGVHAHGERKTEIVAVLRSIGATRAQVLFMYVTQAAVMGLVGASIGAIIGVVVQYTLPVLAADLLPVDVVVTPEWRVITSGILGGGVIALVFALLPLLGLRRISPLQALRRVTEESSRELRRLDLPRVAVLAVLLVYISLIAADRTESTEQGLIMAGSVAAVTIFLLAAAVGFSKAARTVVRPGWPFVLRQGIANLHRPGNQTRAVVLALGFGSFLVTTLYLVQSNLVAQFDAIGANSRGNLLLFDIQEDQAESVSDILEAAGAETLELTPMISMRIAAINGISSAELMADSMRAGGRRWAFRREYRSTYRDSLGPAEKVVEGRWLGTVPRTGDLPEVSFEQEVAGDLGISIGDTVVWDVQGVQVATIVTSLRSVDWARLETNFFAIFGRNAIERAPKQFALLAALSDSSLGPALGQIVTRHANVSAVDLTLIRETVNGIQERASMAVRFTALFSLLMSLPVLLSATAATRRGRVREGVLLRVLGATRSQTRRIMLAEYLSLGAIAAAMGVSLGVAGAFLTVTFVFEDRFVLALTPIVVLGLALAGITAVVGVLAGRDAYKTTATEALRSE